MALYKKLVGDSVYLSPGNGEYIEQCTEWLNDFETTDYLGRSSAMCTEKMEKEYFNAFTDDRCFFFIVTKDENKVIGSISLMSVNHVNRTATLGIMIGDKTCRNKGYGTEAIKLLLDFGFNYLNLNNINLAVMSFNERAIRCYKKCGFKEYGRRRKCRFINGQYYDTIFMDILAEEFKESYIRNKNI